MLDKYKSCKDHETGQDCPDRQVGCHGTCEGYICRCQEREEQREKQRLNQWKPTAHYEKARVDLCKKQKKLLGYKR